MISVAALYVYPIKSLGGIAVNSSRITSRGLEYDRRWMLVDENSEFLTQRIYPQMALLSTGIENGHITVYHKDDPADMIRLSLTPGPAAKKMVKIWDDSCEAQYAEDDLNEWFSSKIGVRCKAVYMPEASERKVDHRFAVRDVDITSFADAYPILLISEASLEDLNSRLQQPVPMDRFRPNIVLTGSAAFAEDQFKAFKIKSTVFNGVKLCSRCVMTTINQVTGEKGKEPLRTLASYRTFNNKICFGQNIISSGFGQIQVGDEIQLLEEGNVPPIIPAINL